MKKRYIKQLLIFVTLLLIMVFLFYKFITYDRNYSWSKEYSIELQDNLSNNDFEIQSSHEISPDSIKLTIEKRIKLKIQKALTELYIMNYGIEFGEKSVFYSSKTNQRLVFKAWCLSDHLVGIEIEYENFDSSSLKKIKERLVKQFPNYKIIWTNKQ
ncbi:hypothetical protein [Flavobacterium sp. PL002]|uniref:hypothetical protein n=1 Tax=Flavobacterium sp. PL002 TaxID=1897058 RepID=UPI00178879A8|nr:hypothetical protein [Flavobacterium sp. PL002]MBE0391837.1 hypothetical protein [Flavobacterium sp. PL002]